MSTTNKIVFKSYKPLPHQMAVHKLLMKYDKGYTITVLSRRQAGKSLMAQNILLERAINKSNSTSIYIAPTFKHCKKIYSELFKAVIKSKIVTSYDKSDFILTFGNGSTIQFLSAQQKENLRGYTVSGILVIDEAAYIDDEIFDIVTHFTNVHNTSTVLISTPFVTAGKFYESFQKGLMGMKGFLSVDWKLFDLTKLLSNELLLKYKENLPERVFKTEILGEFITGGGLVFENFKQCVYNDIKASDKPMYVGIDWATGRGTDYTIITYMTASRRVTHQIEYKTYTPAQQIKLIIAELNQYSNLKILAESNSIGQVYISQIETELKNGNKITEFNTSNQSKKDLVDELILAFDNKKIEIPNDAKLLKQIELFGMKYSVTKKLVTYGATIGNDDRVISLALAYHISNTNKGTYNIR